MSSLYELTTEYQQLLDLGASDDPEDIQAFLDTLEGLDFEVGLKADNYAAVIKRLSGQYEVVKAEARRLSELQRAIDANIDRMKQALKDSMIAMGKDEIRTDLHQFKICKNGGKQPIEIDQEEVPDNFKKVILETDSEQIRKALEAGEELPFARFKERGTYLRIK